MIRCNGVRFQVITMRKTSFLLCGLLLALVAPLAPAASLEGDWLGTLQAGPQKLRLLLHIGSDSDGKLTATLDSLDQGATGLPVDSIQLEGNQLSFKMNRLQASYTGILSDDGASITGTWTQGGASLPLVFRKTGDEPEASR